MPGRYDFIGNKNSPQADECPACGLFLRLTIVYLGEGDAGHFGVGFFTHLVDDLEIPVICYGLRTDFQMHLFEGSMWLLAWADKIEELKTVCWCGSGARCNARIDSNGKMIHAGKQVEVGANERYIALCRKHHVEGKTGLEKNE